MLPPAAMRTTQKSIGKPGHLLAALCLVAILAGCTPPEQTALETGSRLLAAGNAAGALAQLQDARARIEKHPSLKTNLVVVSTLYNQLGLAHQILSKGKTGAAKSAELREAKKCFALAVDNGSPAGKIQAYQNLALLQLEAQQWKAADNAFESLLMTIRDTKSTNHQFDLWLEKGTAEFGADRIADAKASFNKIPSNPSAQNNLGNIAWKEKKYSTAADYFERAIALDNNNTLALRNLGAARQQMRQYAAALKAYRKYLDLVPNGDSDIKNLADSIEEYLKPEPIPESEQAPEPEPVVEVEPEPKEEVKPAPVIAEVEPEPEPEPTNVVIVEPPVEEPEPVEPVPEVVTVVEPAPLPVPEAKPEPTEPTEPKPEPKPEPVTASAETTTAELEPAKPAKSWKQRLKPKNWFGGDDKEKAAKPEKKRKFQISWRSTTPVPTTPLPSSAPVAKASTNTVKVASVLPSAVAFPKYKYLNPALPNNGDRRVAKTYFDDGVAAQKAEEWQRAKAAYLEAAKADPAWFDARFELGQAAFYTGETDLALQSFEHALAIHPNDGPARFNFAMSLGQGNYYAAAAREFETFLQFDPDSVPGHFEAGKLYADKLNDVARAGIHYKRVIGLQPDHPQAVTIRYWLIRNKAN